MKHNTKSRVACIGLFVVMAVMLYSCGGGGGGTSYGGGGGTTTYTVQLVACPAGGTTDVSIVSVAAGFSPSSVGPVSVNTIVKWTNSDTMTHTVTSTTVPLYGTFNESVSAGASVCLKFTSAGTFNYKCSLHPTMPTGMVLVQ